MLSNIIGYVITALFSSVATLIAKAWHNYWLKKQAEKKNDEAVNQAESNDDTSGLFGGKP